MFHSTLFWVAVAFVGLIALAYKPVGKILCKLLDSRANQVQSDLEEALRLKEEAQELLANYQRKQKEVLEESAKIVAFAEEEAARIREQSAKDLEDAVEKRVAMAMQKIESHEARVLQDVRNHAVDIAVSTVRAMVSENLSRDIAEDLVARSIQEVDKKLN